MIERWLIEFWGPDLWVWASVLGTLYLFSMSIFTIAYIVENHMEGK